MKIKMMMLLFVLATLNLFADEPPTGTTTVIGGVLVDLYGSYWMYTEPRMSHLPIRIVVEYQTEEGKTKAHNFKIETDENGYFKIENAPAGKYIFKAIEMNIGQSTHITAASKFGRWAKGEQYRYWGLLSGQMYRNERYLIETIFESESDSGLVDLGITYLTININERLGGTAFKNYSPNSQPPWLRMSLNQGASRLVDLSMVEYETRDELIDVKLNEKETPVTMVAPRDYFKIDN